MQGEHYDKKETGERMTGDSGEMRGGKGTVSLARILVVHTRRKQSD